MGSYKYYSRDFSPGGYYHIYNRGARKINIYKSEKDYEVFLDIVGYYLKFPAGRNYAYNHEPQHPDKLQLTKLERQPSFSILAYCLMPNHFHFLIKQERDSGTKTSITNFMRRAMIAYSIYFNDAHNLSGSMFEGRYKNVSVTTDEQLLYLTKYIHLNPKEMLKGKKLGSYSYSSYPQYLGSEGNWWLNVNEALSFFSKEHRGLNYKDFVEDKDKQLPSASKLLID